MGRIQTEPWKFESPDEVDVLHVGVDTDTHGMPVVNVVQRMPSAPDIIGIGIDIGMTFSGVSIYYHRLGGGDTYEIIPCESVDRAEPAAKFASVIFEPADGSKPSFGLQALERARRKEPGRAYELFKRYLGVPLDQQPPTDRMDAQRLTTQLLEHIKNQVESYLRERYDLTSIRPVYRFTVPGMWPENKVRAFNQVIRDAHFGEDSRGVVAEPVAMAVAASRLRLTERLRDPRHRFVLICDFGGGTFDVALISTDPTQAVATKATPGGNPDLGMSNLDKALELLIFKKRAYITNDEYQNVLGKGIISGVAFERLWATARARALEDPNLLIQMHSYCEDLKRRICQRWDAGASGVRGQPQVNVWSGTLPGGEEVDVTRDEVTPLIEAMRNTAAQSLHKYVTRTLTNIPDLPDFDPRSISLALVGGGGALLPGIELALRAALPGREVTVINVTQQAQMNRSDNVKVHALGLVQLGAAMVAAQPSLLQERRAPASYGMAVRRYLSEEPPKYSGFEETLKTDPNEPTEQTYIAYRRFFKQNATLPVRPVEINVSPLRPGQQKYQIPIFRGEDEDPFKNQLLGTVSARLPALANSNDQIKIVCFLGDDGEFHVEGRDWTGATSGEVSFDLNDDSI